ncbi:MAG TPA: hypothetical protein ENJ82_07740 [Bacteroidetes bacterium]|nr:hypothetical protein [Bacteroidota bacterium]
MLTLTLTGWTISSCTINQKGPSFQTPESTVAALLQAYDNGDVKLVRDILAPTDNASSIIVEGLKNAKKSGAGFAISNTTFEKIYQDETEASILAKYHLTITDSKHNIIFDGDTVEQYHLIKINDRWYITDLEQYTIPMDSKP